MKTFLENLSHLISNDLAADHARLTSELAVAQAEADALKARVEAQEKKYEALIANLATHITKTLHK